MKYRKWVYRAVGAKADTTAVRQNHGVRANQTLISKNDYTMSSFESPAKRKHGTIDCAVSPDSDVSSQSYSLGAHETRFPVNSVPSVNPAACTNVSEPISKALEGIITIAY
jgi:hypothetical protein